MMKKALALAMLTAIAFATVAQTGGTIKIGGIFDLTGATGDVGAPYSLGVRDFIDYINSKGGVNGAKIELVWTDYKYKVDVALDFYETQLKGKVTAIIGWGTGDTLALAPKVALDKIPFLSASFDETLARVDKNPYNFVVGVTYSDQIRVVLRNIQKTFGKGAKVAIFHHPSAFGESPLAAADKEAGALGLVIAEKVPMAAGLDIAAKLKSLEAAGVKAVIVNTVAVPTLSVVKAYGETGVKIKLYGLNWTVNEDMIKLSGKALDGFVYAAATAFPDEDLPGLAEIRGIKKSDVSKTMKYVQGWATAKVLIEAIRLVKGGVTGEKIKAALETFSGFSTGGIIDPITFTSKSHKGVRRLKLYQFNFLTGKFVAITDYLPGE